MMQDSEEGDLRSAALLNSQSIFLARQRAEEDLIRANAALRRAAETTRFLADASAALAELTDSESTLQRIAALAVPFFADWAAVDVLDGPRSARRLAVTHADPSKVAFVYELQKRFPPSWDDEHGSMAVMRTGRSEWTPVVTDEMITAATHDPAQLELLRNLALHSVICVPLRARRGGMIGALTFATSESGRSYDEADLNAAEDLGERAALAIENARLIEELRESDRRKDEFLAVLAHELRNPLAPVRNAVTILRAIAPPVPELQWAGAVIDRQVAQMTRLIDDLLDASRITRGKLALRREVIRIADIVRDAVEGSGPLIDQAGHKLIVSVPDQPIRLLADRTRLAQVLQNLLNNASRYTDPPGRIELSVRREDGQVSITVSDNGIGITEEAIPSLFSMFSQVDRSERAQGGLGIGLTLVKRLTEMHGGTVEARSEGPGHGSEFIVMLPMWEGADNSHAEQPARVQPGLEKGARILVVDDNKDAADSLAMMLRIMGHDVRAANDGMDGETLAAEFRPDIAFLDLGLPRLSGYELARRIRKSRGPDVLLVAVSGWGQADDRRRTRDAGFNHHLTKPVSREELLNVLSEANSVLHA
ncbi:MAG: hybrid sensor histidine kinase/response regulator [Gemmatimonadota bacterium]